MNGRNLVIDCGTTNLRVTLLGEDNRPAATAKAEGGVRNTAVDGHNGRLRALLRESIESVLSQGGISAADVSRCVAYGMITSDMGLMELGHLCAPASAADLRRGMREAVFEDVAPFPIAFIPGVRNFSGEVNFDNVSGMDMMRGEETEAVGLYDLLAPGGEAVFILPGSHNKFVSMGDRGQILGCMTSISGELLDALTHHTILADAVGHAFVSAEDYDETAAREGAWECARSGLGRAAFAGRILSTLGKLPRASVQSYLLGAALALDVEALGAFLPSRPDETLSPMAILPDNVLGAMGVAQPQPTSAPRIYVAGKPPVQRAMCDVLDALGFEGAQQVPREISARMGTHGAAVIAQL